MALFRWLNTPSSVSWLVVTGTLLLLFLAFLNVACGIIYFSVFGSSLMPDWQGLGAMSEEEQFGFFARGLCCVPFGCLIEEVISRVPLTLVGKKWPGSAMPFLVAIPLSIFFGWLHGGWATVPYQGFCGLILCLYYLKAGGQEGKLLRPLWVSYLIHTIYDVVLYSLALVGSLAMMS